MKIPKSLALVADKWYAIRAERLALQKQVDALQVEETQLSEHLINNLPKNDATGIAGKLVQVTVGTKIIYNAADWDEIRAYVIKQSRRDPGIWAIMGKSLNNKTLRDMADAGHVVPGTQRAQVPVLHHSKVGAA